MNPPALARLNVVQQLAATPPHHVFWLHANPAEDPEDPGLAAPPVILILIHNGAGIGFFQEGGRRWTGGVKTSTDHIKAKDTNGTGL